MQDKAVIQKLVEGGTFIQEFGLFRLESVKIETRKLFKCQLIYHPSGTLADLLLLRVYPTVANRDKKSNTKNKFRVEDTI